MKNYLHRLVQRLEEKELTVFVFFWGVIGVLDLLSLFTPFDYIDSRSLGALPLIVETWIALVWVAGAVFMALSIYEWSTLNQEWIFQRLAWLSSGAGWTCYGISVFGRSQTYLITYGSMACLIIAAAFSLRKVTRTESIVRDALKR